MIIDHVGIAVKFLEDGIQHWEKLFGYQQIVDLSRKTLKPRTLGPKGDLLVFRGSSKQFRN